MSQESQMNQAKPIDTVMSESNFLEVYGVPKTGKGREFEDLISDVEFQEYYKTLNSNPYYTRLTTDERQSFEDYSKPILNFSMAYANKHPFLWAKWVCGINLYDYQFKMVDEMQRSKFMIFNTARQIGKSLVIAVFAFWAAYNNIFPVGIDKKTKIGIVSATEDQAKKLLRDIYTVVQTADGIFGKLSKGTELKDKQYFTNKMKEKPTAYKLQWSAGSIECFPPTKKLRGNSLSFLFIDEGDFLGCEDPDYFFNSEAMPTLKKTDGCCYPFSTPKGLPSYYQDIFRPFEEKPATGWKRIWYNWTIYQNDWVNGWIKYKQALEQGKLADFEAEYEAKFTSGRHSFFSPLNIDECVEDRESIDECNYQVFAGVDFGAGGAARTAVTLAYFDEREQKSIILLSKEFPLKYHNDKLVDYFNKLKLRYRIHTIVAEQCPAGFTPIELLKNARYKVIEFNSRADKIIGYENMLIAVNNKRVELYQEKTMLSQLKGLEAHETNMGNIQIKKASGMLDDVADSVMFAISEFTKPKRRLGKRRVL